ncbi:hypothetical protein NQ317_009175 [Molorchus minor]|uniref:Zinc finger PHD-type domain-containing protein n=1 Tax=Molorchus minor TaxID=1323400 RepID=A0ABQ9J612_9CUCU|nr:hypothetical protein NQ317_009175 [Molorchus minor]
MLPATEEVDNIAMGRKTPSHLTEQGFLDLKFYHNRLWIFQRRQCHSNYYLAESSAAADKQQMYRCAKIDPAYSKLLPSYGPEISCDVTFPKLVSYIKSSRIVAMAFKYMQHNVISCFKIVSENDSSSLRCSVCKTQWHGVCARPQPDDDSLKSRESWKCEKCLNISTDIDSTHFNAIMVQFSQLNNAISTCNTKIHDLTELVITQSQTINTCVTDISALRKENQNLQSKITNLETNYATQKNSAEDIWAEMAERTRREKKCPNYGTP